MLALASTTAVLLVDDHADTASMLARYLSKRGLDAESVLSAEEAIEFLGREMPRCIILDESMPGMSGLDLFKLMIAHDGWKNIPVVFYSGAYDWRKQMEAEVLGAKAWLVKGVVGIPTLIDTVQACCRS